MNQGVTLENMGGTMNNGTQANHASAVLTIAQGGQVGSYATMNNYGTIANNGGLNDSPVGFILRGSLNNYGIITNSGEMEIDASLTGSGSVTFGNTLTNQSGATITNAAGAYLWNYTPSITTAPSTTRARWQLQEARSTIQAPHEQRGRRDHHRQ